ncbi:hypothetical protein GCM10010201_10750 [Pilimelia columellifera subsp. columellifera]|uniref:Uncharacterized protein n=1 Tax=Pilimelia columellifera subsp. columellifera TaxID=706583 RepID=A0ABN3NBK1_9ACTN
MAGDDERSVVPRPAGIRRPAPMTRADRRQLTPAASVQNPRTAEQTGIVPVANQVRPRWLVRRDTVQRPGPRHEDGWALMRRQWKYPDGRIETDRFRRRPIGVSCWSDLLATVGWRLLRLSADGIANDPAHASGHVGASRWRRVRRRARRG